MTRRGSWHPLDYPRGSVDRVPQLADYHTPEFRALFRYRRLAELAEAAGSRLTAQEARNRAAALRDYIDSKIG